MNFWPVPEKHPNLGCYRVLDENYIIGILGLYGPKLSRDFNKKTFVGNWELENLENWHFNTKILDF